MKKKQKKEETVSVEHSRLTAVVSEDGAASKQTDRQTDRQPGTDPTKHSTARTPQRPTDSQESQHSESERVARALWRP